MSTRETTTISPLGWPTVGELVGKGTGVSVPVAFGNGEVIAVTDSSWARQVAMAMTMAANLIDGALGIDMLPVPVQLGGGTQVMPAVPAVPGGTAAAAHEGQWRASEDSVAS